MKLLPEGSTKYLIFNETEILRNAQRRKGNGPVVVVAEVDESVRGGLLFHSGYGLLTDGPLEATYPGNSKVLFEMPTGYLGRRTKIRSAFQTTARVALAETADEVLSTPKPASPKPAKAPAKPKTEEVTK